MTDRLQAPTSENQPAEYFKALEELVNETIGVKLFTTMEINHNRDVVRRSYTNMPDAYPVEGEKPRHKNKWSEQVEDRQEIFVANSIEEIAEVFPDYELIQSLGCESCINIPVVIEGKVIGTLNCLHDAGHYTAEKLAAAETLKEAGRLAFLIDAQMKGSD